MSGDYPDCNLKSIEDIEENLLEAEFDNANNTKILPAGAQRNYPDLYRSKDKPFINKRACS